MRLNARGESSIAGTNPADWHLLEFDPATDIRAGIMAENNDAYVRFVEVQKSYDGDTLVVKDLNLDIAKGEFLTMLGPSGSGKTTCLMMLAGFETATSGDIVLDGRPINNVAPHKRDIGMVFQNYALFPHMTIHENLSFPLQVRKLPKEEIEQRVQKALDMVELAASAPAVRPSSREASSSGWPWLARSCSSLSSCSWTSLSGRWTSSFESRCSTR